MSGSGDAFIYETITNAIFNGSGEPVTLNGTFEVEFDAGGTLVGVSNISLVADSSDPNTNPSNLDTGTISHVGIPAPYSGDTVNEINVFAAGGSFPNAYLDFIGEEPTALVADPTYGHYSSIGYPSGIESIGSNGSAGTITQTALPLSPVTLDTYVYTTLSNVIFDGNNVPVTLAGTFLTEYDPSGTLLGVSQVSLVASDPSDNSSYPSTLDLGTVSAVGTPGATGDAGVNEIYVTIDANGGGSFQHVALDWTGENPGTLVTGGGAHYSSIGYATGTEALPGAASNAGTNTNNVADTFLMATMSNVIFNGYGGGNPATLSGTFEEEFNAGGTLVGVSNVNLANVTSNGTIFATQIGGFTAGDPNAGGTAAINQIIFQGGAPNYPYIDYIDLQGEEADAVFAGDFNNNHASDPGTGYQPINGYNGIGSSGTIIYEQVVPCFAAGTRILTPRGEVHVEELVAGDLVQSHGAGFTQVKWMGRRRVDCLRHPKPGDVWPVRIMTGAFGPAMPHRDLWLSPDHAVFAEGVLVPIRYLINGTTIMQEERDEVTYWHVELAAHDVLLAEGLPCESYLDTGTRRSFANGGAVVQMHADFGGGAYCEAVWEGLACAPLRIEGPEVLRVTTRLRRRARALGVAKSNRKGRSSAAPRGKLTSDLADLIQPAWYLAVNEDVAAASADPSAHYANHGRSEGRRPCPEVDLFRGLGLIDPASFVFTMPDVVTAGADPVEHFCAIGWTEGRNPNPYFDTGWYLDTHDVPAGMNPLLHYVLFGENQGLPPSRHFDSAWYRARYDIKPTASPLAHYLIHRRTQRFSPVPSFDVAAYRQAHGTAMRPGRDPYAHFLAAGQFAMAAQDQAAQVAA